MRIHDQNPANLNPAGASDTRGASQSQGPQAAVPAQGTGPEAIRSSNHGPDRVSLSNLAATLQPSDVDREAEVERLGALFDRGLYEADAGVVAEGLIQEGLTRMPGEPGEDAGPPK